jgi:hypothetical protein
MIRKISDHLSKRYQKSFLPLSVVVADKGYDSEDNHVLVIEEELHAFSMYDTCKV